MHIETNNAAHFGDFIRLNELWISEHFSIEEADRELAANPGKVVSDGGYIFSLLDGERVVGVCALFKESPQRYQLARMAVELAARGNGYGNRLIEHALAHVNKHFNVLGRYHFSTTDAVLRGELRPLRDPEDRTEYGLMSA